eukprot:m51a1_g1848 hypothetical protein (743) ;mRNA; f:588384-591635
MEAVEARHRAVLELLGLQDREIVAAQERFQRRARAVAGLAMAFQTAFGDAYESEAESLARRARALVSAYAEEARKAAVVSQRQGEASAGVTDHTREQVDADRLWRCFCARVAHDSRGEVRPEALASSSPEFAAVRDQYAGLLAKRHADEGALAVAVCRIVKLTFSDAPKPTGVDRKLGKRIGKTCVVELVQALQAGTKDSPSVPRASQQSTRQAHSARSREAARAVSREGVAKELRKYGAGNTLFDFEEEAKAEETLASTLMERLRPLERSSTELYVTDDVEVPASLPTDSHAHCGDSGVSPIRGADDLPPGWYLGVRRLPDRVVRFPSFDRSTFLERKLIDWMRPASVLSFGQIFYNSEELSLSNGTHTGSGPAVAYVRSSGAELGGCHVRSSRLMLQGEQQVQTVEACPVGRADASLLFVQATIAHLLMHEYACSLLDGSSALSVPEKDRAALRDKLGKQAPALKHLYRVESDGTCVWMSPLLEHEIHELVGLYVVRTPQLPCSVVLFPDLHDAKASQHLYCYLYPQAPTTIRPPSSRPEYLIQYKLVVSDTPDEDPVPQIPFFSGVCSWIGCPSNSVGANAQFPGLFLCSLHWEMMKELEEKAAKANRFSRRSGGVEAPISRFPEARPSVAADPATIRASMPAISDLLAGAAEAHLQQEFTAAVHALKSKQGDRKQALQQEISSLQEELRRHSAGAAAAAPSASSSPRAAAQSASSSPRAPSRKAGSARSKSWYTRIFV